jgi:C-terminal processing protease CtpA/Prc
MNSLFKKILITTSLICLSGIKLVNAQACASVSINQESGKQYFYDLYLNNGVLTDSMLIKKDEKLYLEPGDHTLTFRQWDPLSYKKIKNQKSSSAVWMRLEMNRTEQYVKKIKTINVQITVGNNKHYVLVNNELNKISIQEEKDQVCDENKVNILAAKKTKKENVVIPPQLTYRLYEVMQSIQKNDPNKRESISSLVPIKVMDYFGAIVDKKRKSTNTKEQLVIAVTPYSLASRLGLKAGDKIKLLGGKAISNLSWAPYDPLTNYIVNLNGDKKLAIKVLRGVNEVMLNGKYESTIMPEFTYSVGENKVKRNVTNELEIAKKSQRLLSLTMLQIMSLKDIKNSNSDIIAISQPAMYDPKYGINGSIVSNDKHFGFNIKSVVQGSPADKLGLKRNDVVIAINSQKIKSNSVNMLSSNITNLAEGESYTILVKRKDSELELTDVLHRRLFPKFSLMIDLESYETVKSPKSWLYLMGRKDTRNTGFLAVGRESRWSNSTPDH